MKISQRAFDLIIREEVSSQEFYERKYRHPIWPGVQSGVTIGIGYDVGHHTREQVRADWGGRLPAHMVEALQTACGVTGKAAKPLAQSLQAVDVPWSAAIAVFRDVDVPKWTGIVERALPNTDKLHGDSLGALVSLTYNRGASFNKDGDRYNEMRAIKAHMTNKQFAHIPSELRAMKRIWPDVRGLQDRRGREAVLFERGLSAPALPGMGTGGTVATTTVVIANEAKKQNASDTTIGIIVAVGFVLAIAAFVIVNRFRS